MEERREDRIGYVNVMLGSGASKQKVDKVGIRVKLIAVPESGKRKVNLTTLVLVKKNGKVKRGRFRQRSQSPLRIRSNGLVQLEALGKDVVANHNDHKGRRSEAPPGEVHHSDMVPEGETQPVSLVDRKWQSGSKITLDLPWRQARAGATRGERE